MANKKIREREIQAASKAKYDLAKKSLTVWPLIVSAVTLIAIALFFFNWIEVYNVDSSGANGGPFVEIKGTGFDALISCLTNDYTSAQSPFYMFYYWIHVYSKESYIVSMCICALVAFFALIALVVIEAVAFFTKNHQLSIIAVGLGVIAFIACLLGFVFALSCHGIIIHNYCNDNPDCSIRSWAILPAIASLVSAALALFHFLKYRKAELLSA